MHLKTFLPSKQFNKLLHINSIPLKLHESISDKVFKTLPSVKTFFHAKKYENNPMVQELLEIYQDVMDENKYFRELDLINLGKLPKMPFIVVEGLDGCGKTTQCNKLIKHFDAVYYHSPPDYLNDLKKKFSKFTTKERTAFYTMANYFVSMDLLDLCRTKPVILDRYWHGTTAMGIAQELLTDPKKIKMPYKADPIFDWPIDLLKPDIVLLLAVSENVRRFRQFNRKGMTQQEHLLNTNRDYRNNTLELFARMRNPSVTVIDSNDSPEKVFLKIISALESIGIVIVPAE